MISPEFNLNFFTSDLSLYLKNQVKIGLFGSGVGLSVVLGFSAAYVCYYLMSVAKKPLLIAGGKKFHQFLRDQCPVVSETYYPTFWCWESRVQTLLRPLVTARPRVNYRNELIRASDGGQISLDWFDNNDSASYPDPSTRPTVLLLPGLTGTSRESYILHMVQQSHDLGYRCVVFNNRGVSGEKLLTPRTYCAANTEDLEVVVDHIHKIVEKAPLMAAGVSMGGMMLANYLGRKGSETCLKGVVLFSACWDVFECTASLEKPLDRFLFNSYLTSCLQAFVDRHRTVLEKKYNIDHVMKAKTIREFDERFTSVMFGYPTNEDYYLDASPSHKIKSVQVPMLCLNAADDVFSPNHAIPVEAVKQNPNVALLITCHGGHIGFLEGLWPRQSTYMDRVFCQFTKAILENGSSLTDLH
ncbi:phospholipase ABHD3-like [Myxocyprinus asiaticus]|uniref:phospholipase ABHD3-like n=1 Tax=Myxocyprinus asiaticus TaxID=70543 RepID=UPI002222B1C6|nr:phospholipase ABHD3-like [Myxocyprinus asiaticus]